MKVHTYQITTKAFHVRVRVQNDRIVDIHHLLGMYKRGRYSQLLGWLERSFGRGGFSIKEQ